jgi:ribosome-associated translation inhibitor RaiA
MKLHFRGDKALVAAALRTTAELRVRLVLGRFGNKIDKVTLRLTKGGVGNLDKLCQISIGVKPNRVRVACTHADLSVAIERAAERAARATDRMLLVARVLRAS